MKRATITFAAGQRVVARGQMLPDTDPLVKKHPGLFEVAPASEKPKRSRARKGGPRADGET